MPDIRSIQFSVMPDVFESLSEEKGKQSWKDFFLSKTETGKKWSN